MSAVFQHNDVTVIVRAFEYSLEKAYAGSRTVVPAAFPHPVPQAAQAGHFGSE